MPNTASAIRAVREIQRRTKRNETVERALQKVLRDVRNKDVDLSLAYSALDRAAKVNIIHWKKAARLKSRLSIAIHKPVEKRTNIKRSSKKSSKRKLKAKK